MNWDSYLGHTGHNYFLYEENGVLSILPWDYNLAFGTYALGMTDPIKDPNILINYPINTPAEGEVMLNRPLYHNLMKHDEYFSAITTISMNSFRNILKAVGLKLFSGRQKG